MVTGFKLPEKYLGIKIDFDISVIFLIAILFNAVSSMMIGRLIESSNLAIVLCSSFVAVAVLASVLAHELGHVFVGQKFGVDFSGITIFFLGGAAKMSSPIPNPKAEFWMAIAGPAVSLLLAVIFFVLGVFADNVSTNTTLAMALVVVGVINAAMAIFNLLPAFPLDGGRIFRSLIWGITKDKFKSTLISGRIGQMFGVAFVVVGILPILGVTIPFLTTGISSGLWKTIIGGIIILFAQVEIQSGKRQLRIDREIARAIENLRRDTNSLT